MLRVPDSAIDFIRALVGTVVILAVIASIPVLAMPFLWEANPGGAIELGLAIGLLTAVAASPFVFLFHWQSETRSRAIRRADAEHPHTCP